MTVPDVAELRLLRTSRITIRHQLIVGAAGLLAVLENALDADTLAVEQLRGHGADVQPLGGEWQQLRAALEQAVGAR